MKKLLLCLILFFCIEFCEVKAELIPLYMIKKGDIYNSKDYIDTIEGILGTWQDKGYNLVYLDQDDNILQGFTLINDWEDPDPRIGATCLEVYEKEATKYLDLCKSQLNMLEDKEMTNIGYWEVVSSSDITLEEFCSAHENVKNSYTCEFGDRYSRFIIFKEYVPVSFELTCSPKEVKINQTTNCKLKVSATKDISSIVFDIPNDLYTLEDIKVADDWSLVENNDSKTITLTNSGGFIGESTILDITLLIKDDIKDTLDIELNNILYITTDEIEMKSNVSDNVDIYDEPINNDQVKNEKEESQDEVENKNDEFQDKEETKNPNTVDIFYVVLISFFIVVLLLSVSPILRNKIR